MYRSARKTRRRFAQQARWFASVCVGLAGLSGCVEHRLDFVAESLDKWGTVSLSGATLIEPDPRFQLDLELSGDEIFRRNRVEGYSAIRQYDSLDVQVSVQAEVVANLLDQMSAAGDPKLVDQLRTQLMAASFKGLLGSLPPEQQAKLGPLLDPVSTFLERRGGTTGADGGAAGALPGSGGDGAGVAVASDGGLGLYQAAQEYLAGAVTKLADARQAKDDVTAAPSGPDGDLARKSARDRAVNLTIESVLASRTAANHARDAANAAFMTVADAQRRFAQLPPEVRATATAITTQLSEATTAANTALALADGVIGQADSAGDMLREVQGKTDKVDKDVDDAINKAAEFTGPATDEPQRSVSALLEKTLAAVNAARAAAVVAGAPLGPIQKPQKLLEAPEIDVNKLLARKKVPEFAPALEPYEGPVDLNLRQLLLLTASDKMTLEMLRWLSYPRDSAPNKRVYLCMASVNVVPGKLTYKGYNAQVDLFMELGFLDRDGSVRVSRPTVEPTVFAVFPFVDSQVLDLRTSRRQAFTLALQLIVNGYPAAARGLLDYARQREQDIETMTGFNTVTSYSNGRHLGFTFSPRVVAQEDPTKMNTTPSWNLQPQTFPVMILVVVDEESARDAYEGLRFADMQAAGGSSFVAVAAAAAEQAQTEQSRFLAAPTAADAEARANEVQEAEAGMLRASEDALRAAEELLRRCATLDAPRIAPSELGTQIDDARAEIDAAQAELAQARMRATQADVRLRLLPDGGDSRAASLQELADALAPVRRPDLVTTVANAVAAAQTVALRAGVELAPALSGTELTERRSPTHLVWYQTHRWMRAPDLGADRWPLGQTISDWFTPRLKETEMVERARSLDRVYEYVRDHRAGDGDPRRGRYGETWVRAGAETYETTALETRMHYLGAHAVGTVTKFALPLFESDDNDALGTLTVAPTTLWLDEPVTLFIASDAAEPFRQGFAVTIGGRSVNASRLSPNVLKVVMPPWLAQLDPGQLAEAQAAGRLEADVVVTNGTGVASAGRVTFLYHTGRGYAADVGVRRTAALTADPLVIQADSDQNRNKVVMIAVSPPVAGVTHALILVPAQDAAGKEIVLELPANVNVNGLVTAQQAITFDKAKSAWGPQPAYGHLAGKSVKSVRLRLTLPGGGLLELPVDGTLEVRPVTP